MKWRKLDLTAPLHTQVYGAERAFESHFNAAGKEKQGYDSRTEAQSVADQLFARGGQLARPYLCNTCERWHIGGVR